MISHSIRQPRLAAFAAVVIGMILMNLYSVDPASAASNTKRPSLSSLTPDVQKKLGIDARPDGWVYFKSLASDRMVLKNQRNYDLQGPKESRWLVHI